MLASREDVVRALITYTDWWQPVTASIYEVGAARRSSSDGDGIRLTAAIRSLLGDMRDEEERSLVDHQAISDRDFQRIARKAFVSRGDPEIVAIQ